MPCVQVCPRLLFGGEGAVMPLAPCCHLVSSSAFAASEGRQGKTTAESVMDLVLV